MDIQPSTFPCGCVISTVSGEVEHVACPDPECFVKTEIRRMVAQMRSAVVDVGQGKPRVAELEDQRRFPVEVDGNRVSVYQDHLLSHVAKAAGGDAAKDAIAFRVYVGDKTRVIVRVGAKESFRDIPDAMYRESSAERMLEVEAVKELMPQLTATK